MQLDKAHLTYCTNIHAGESWEEHFGALKENFPDIKLAISPEQPMGIGLRLSNSASTYLAKTENIATFKQWLEEHDAYVFTMNGFPYGDFHHTRVKEQVHSPDWTTTARVDYTLRMFSILQALLPAGMDGGISTSPLSYRHWFGDQESLHEAKTKATHNVLLVALHLIEIKLNTSTLLHLDIEPEPDGILETGNEFIEWYKEYLIPAGVRTITQKFGISALEAELMLKEHVCLCYDVCHFSIGYENHKDIVNKLIYNNIKIGKIQISAALKSSLDKLPAERDAVIRSFSGFAESTYLHQVVALTNDDTLVRYPDLPAALADAGNAHVTEWRAHFHVPVFLEDFGRLQSTRSDITDVLKNHNECFLSSHLEVETYTWEVLPPELKLPLKDSIIRELQWVKDQLI